MPSILRTGHLGFIARGLEGDGIDLKDGVDILTYRAQKQYDVVIHAAALTSVTASADSPEEYWRTNVYGTLNMLRQHPESHFVYLSTAAVYGEGMDHTLSSPLRPGSIYALTKLRGEYLVQSYAKSWTILRLTNVVGDGQRDDPNVYQVFRSAKVITIFGSGLQTRDFIDVNVVRATIMKLLDKPGIFNVGSGVSKTIWDVARGFNKKIVRRLSRPGEIRNFGVKDAVHFDP